MLSYPSLQNSHYPLSKPTFQNPQANVVQQQHTDVIHDTQFNYYGEMLATASSDRTIGIYTVVKNQAPHRVATLVGHNGPVWMVSWAAPSFGNVIASAGYDRKAIIWKEHANKKWNMIHVVDAHSGSVNAVHWAPQEFGAILASGSSDGSVAVTRFVSGSWQETVKLSVKNNCVSHAMGCTSVAFCPFSSLYPNSIFLASGGCDRQIRIWKSSSETSHHYSVVSTIDLKTDRVSDVAFSPSSAGSSHVILASCHGNTITVHRKLWSDLVDATDSLNDSWESSAVEVKDSVWRLSWSPCGEMLLATTSTSEVFVLHQGGSFADKWILQPITN